MAAPPQTNLLPLLKKLLQQLKPYAKKKNITLHFSSNVPEIKLVFAVNELSAGFSKLISSIIDFIPEGQSIYVEASIKHASDTSSASIKIRNTGIYLKMVNGLTKNSPLPISLFSSAPFETIYEVCYPLEPLAYKPPSAQKEVINYTAVVKGIQTHFLKFSNPVARLAESSPKEAAFLTKINKCISENMDDEQFDANALSLAMAMSRAQLLRRLKSLTGNSPGFYIKTVRLEKAKMLLESAHISVSEAAFQTGFGSPSNFSKVFYEKYGITPSQFRRANPNATNK